jgi:hypothetical protein
MLDRGPEAAFIQERHSNNHRYISYRGKEVIEKIKHRPGQHGDQEQMTN